MRKSGITSSYGVHLTLVFGIHILVFLFMTLFCQLIAYADLSNLRYAPFWQQKKSHNDIHLLKNHLNTCISYHCTNFGYGYTRSLSINWYLSNLRVTYGVWTCFFCFGWRNNRDRTVPCTWLHYMLRDKAQSNTAQSNTAEVTWKC